MKKFSVFAVATLAVAAFAASSHAALIINEVYPGGGSSSGSPAYTRDFVEIYNTSSTPVSLAGYSLQYASSANSFTNTIVNFGAGSVIGGNDYVTVVTGSAGTAGATLTASDATYIAPTTSASLSGTSGAVRLFDGTSAVDIVGYGTITSPGANGGDIKVEGTAAASPTSTAVSLTRTNFVDTNNNSADFSSATPTPQKGTASIVLVPEPTTLAALAGVGLVGFARRRRA